MAKISTDRKIAANRKNAKASTGPKTKLGRDKAKLNAVKHGAYATTAILQGEDRDLYSAIRSEQRKRFKPHTFVEKALVDQLVNELWTLRRITRAEYFLGREVQRDLREDAELDGDAPLVDQGTKLRLLQQQGVEALERGSAEQKILVRKDLNDIRKAQEKLHLIDQVYLEFYCQASQERTQKLMWLKRSCLQNILGIERELDRRLRGRDARSKED